MAKFSFPKLSKNTWGMILLGVAALAMVIVIVMRRRESFAPAPLPVGKSVNGIVIEPHREDLPNRFDSHGDVDEYEADVVEDTLMY